MSKKLKEIDMLKLLQNNLIRITKSKAFWICSAVYLVFGLMVSLAVRQEYVWEMHVNGKSTFTNFGYSASPATGLIVLTYLCLIIGQDVKNNAIRNKIIIGYSKSEIYLSNLFAFAICISAVNAVYVFHSLLAMPNKTFTLLKFIWTIFNNIVAISFYVSLYLLIIMNTQNAVATLIFGSLLTLCAAIISQVIIHGVINGVNDFLLVLLTLYPTGFDTAIANGLIINSKIFVESYYGTYLDVSKTLIYLCPLIAIGMTAVTASIGTKIFKRSNIK